MTLLAIAIVLSAGLICYTAWRITEYKVEGDIYIARIIAGDEECSCGEEQIGN